MSGRHRGFTLIELLVVMLIILILAGITLAAVNIAASGDRVPGGARQAQSMIEGARDRAIYAGEPRGVRLVLDPNDPNPQTASSFVFVGASESYGAEERHGTVTVVEFPPLSGSWFVREDNPAKSVWGRMVQRGLLRQGARITFGDQDRWYTLLDTPVDLGDGTGRYASELSRPYVANTPPPDAEGYGGLRYRVSLAPAVLPNEEPRALPRGIAIDLKSSYVHEKIPASWYAVTDDGGNGSNGPAARMNDTVQFGKQLAGTVLVDQPMDIVFNPQGTIHGRLAAQGVLSLLVADAVDVQAGFRARIGNAGTTDVNGDGEPDERAVTEAVISVFTASGTVVVSSVDEADANSDNLRDDPWYLAEVGGEL